MSIITRKRSSRSGMYHSCWRSQLRCQAAQSVPGRPSVAVPMSADMSIPSLT
jgi:hypothetical protein